MGLRALRLARARRLRAAAGRALVLVLVVAGSACARHEPRGELLVLAAASLTEAFSAAAESFEAGRPGVRVALAFGPSSGLAVQILEGAPADVFASASPRWMDAVAASDAGLRRRAVFATNRLVAITPGDDPAGIAAFGDLARPGLRLVLAARGVPAGDYAREALARAGIGEAAEANLVSNEEDVKAVVQKVLLGEADAGIVYRSDVTPRVAPSVRVVALPDAVNVLATYPVAVLGASGHPELADAFVDFLLAHEGREILARSGLGPPPDAP